MFGITDMIYKGKARTHMHTHTHTHAHTHTQNTHTHKKTHTLTLVWDNRHDIQRQGTQKKNPHTHSLLEDIIGK